MDEEDLKALGNLMEDAFHDLDIPDDMSETGGEQLVDYLSQVIGGDIGLEEAHDGDMFREFAESIKIPDLFTTLDLDSEEPASTVKVSSDAAESSEKTTLAIVPTTTNASGANTEIAKDTFDQDVTAFGAALLQINDELAPLPQKKHKEKDSANNNQLEAGPSNQKDEHQTSANLPSCFEHVFSEEFLQNRKKYGLRICSVIAFDVLKLSHRVLHGRHGHKHHSADAVFPANRRVYMPSDKVKTLQRYERDKRHHYSKKLTKILRKEKLRVGIKVNGNKHHHHHSNQNDKKKERPPEKYSAGGTRILSFEKRHDSQIKRPKMREPSPPTKRKKEDKEKTHKPKAEPIKPVPLPSSFRIPKRNIGPRHTLNTNYGNKISSSGARFGFSNPTGGFNTPLRSSGPRESMRFDKSNAFGAGIGGGGRAIRQSWHESYKRQMEQKMKMGGFEQIDARGIAPVRITNNYYQSLDDVNDRTPLRDFENNLNNIDNWDDDTGNNIDDDDNESDVPPPITKANWDKTVAREVNKLIASSGEIQYPGDTSVTISLAHKFAWWYKTTQKDPVPLPTPSDSNSNSTSTESVPELEDHFKNPQNANRQWNEGESFVGNVSDPDGDVDCDPNDKAVSYENVDPEKTDEWIGQQLVQMRAKYRVALGPNGDFISGEFKPILDFPRGLNYDKESFQATCTICDEFVPGKKELGVHLRSAKHHEHLKNLSLKIKAKNERTSKAQITRYNSCSNSVDAFDSNSLFDNSLFPENVSSVGESQLFPNPKPNSSINNNDPSLSNEKLSKQNGLPFAIAGISENLQKVEKEKQGKSAGVPPTPKSPWSTFAMSESEEAYSPGMPLDQSPLSTGRMSPESPVSSAGDCNTPFNVNTGGSFLQPLVPQLYSSQIPSPKSVPPPTPFPPLPGFSTAAFPPPPPPDEPGAPPPPPPADVDLETCSMSVSSDEDAPATNSQSKVTVDDVKSTWDALTGQFNYPNKTTDQNRKSPMEEGEAGEDEDEVDEKDFDGFDIAEVLNLIIELRDVLQEPLINRVLEYHQKAEELEAVKAKQSYNLLFNEDFVLLLIQARDQCISSISNSLISETTVLQSLNMANYVLNLVLQTDVCRKVYQTAVDLGLVAEPAPGLTDPVGTSSSGRRDLKSSSSMKKRRRSSAVMSFKEKKYALVDLLSSNLMSMGRNIIGEGKFLEKYVTKTLCSVMPKNVTQAFDEASLRNSYTGKGFKRRHQLGTQDAGSGTFSGLQSPMQMQHPAIAAPGSFGQLDPQFPPQSPWPHQNSTFHNY